MATHRKKVTRLVQWLQKSDSFLIQTFLWLPAGFMPLLWAFFSKKPKEQRRVTVINPSGLYPDKKFYIVRLHDSICGLAALEPLVAANCAKAEVQGYIPVVDMQNCRTIYHEKGEAGKVNAWDYYYRQPCGYSLAEALKGRHVVLGCSQPAYMNFFKHWYFGNPANRAKSHRIFERYIRLNESARRYVDADCRALLPTGQRILGVICRGTDYIGTRPREHAIPPTAERAIQRAKQIMVEQNCSKVFLATEDADNCSAFQEAFSAEQLIVNHALRFRVQPGKLLADYEPTVVREKDRYCRGLEYLSTLTMLSKCQCILGSSCSSYNFACYRCTDREYSETIDLGVYE